MRAAYPVSLPVAPQRERILDSIAKGTSCFPIFFAWSIPTSPFIQWNDFYTCYTYFLLCGYAHEHVNATPRVIRES